MVISTINGISICSGLGGIELGLGSVIPGLRTVCYVEREVPVAEVLAARIADGCLDDAPIWSDLRTFDPAPWRGKVHLLSGGFPCQPFSYASQHRLQEADERNLWPDVRRIIDGLGVPRVFLENVPGILDYWYSTCRRELRSMGYQIEEGLFTASEVGAPHKRERLFILAHRDGEPSDIFQRSSRPEPDRIGEGLAHAERRATERQRHGLGGTTGETESEIREQRLRADVRDGRDQLAYASDTRLQRVRPSRQDERPSRPCSIPLFPPGPTDRDGWAYMLNEMPEVEPTICSVANGVSSGLDRALRALGNAVVPSVAATAWLQLNKTLMERRSNDRINNGHD